MNESELKRALLKSLAAQDGEGFRMEDRYAVGRPDLFLSPANLPPFLAEVKLVKGAKLICTEKQAYVLEKFDRPPFLHAVIIGYHVKGRALYIGKPEQKLVACRYVPRPRVLESSEWWITELLGKWHEEKAHFIEYETEWSRREVPAADPAGRPQSHARLRRRAKADTDTVPRERRRAPRTVVEQPAGASAGRNPGRQGLPKA